MAMIVKSLYGIRVGLLGLQTKQNLQDTLVMYTNA